MRDEHSRPLPGKRRRLRQERRVRSAALSALTAGGGLAVAATLLSGAASEASTKPTVTVTSLGDTASPSAGNVVNGKAPTLADAIEYIDATSAGGTITFASDLTGTIDLTSYLPLISKPTDVDGPGANRLTIDDESSSADPVIHVVAGQTQYSEISGVTITGGIDGGVYTVSPLRVTGVTVTGNQSSDNGAGIFADGVPLQLIDSRVASNDTTDSGGGIDFVGSGQLTIDGSTVSGNNAVKGGGVEAVGDATTVIYDSTISGNTATNDTGGLGFYDDSATVAPHAFIENSTVAYNISTEFGGIYIGDDGAGGLATLTVVGSTIADNAATAGSAGGISDGVASVKLYDSILAGNSDTASGSSHGPDLWISTGSPAAAKATARFSLIGDATATGEGSLQKNTTDRVGSAASPLNPGLGPLQSNGGQTETMRPEAGSSALRRGNAGQFIHARQGLPFDTDQRGQFRLGVGGSATHGDHTDIGAVEVTQTTQTRSFNKGSQHFALTTAAAGLPVEPGQRLPLVYSSSTRSGRSPKLSFARAVITISGSAQRHTYRSASTITTLRIGHLARGHHTLRATVSYRERRHRRTTTVIRTLTLKVDIG